MRRIVHDMIGTLKAMQWELAKGHLRSLVALEGSVSGGESERPYRFERVSERIEAFIKDMDNDGLSE